MDKIYPSIKCFLTKLFLKILKICPLQFQEMLYIKFCLKKKDISIIILFKNCFENIHTSCINFDILKCLYPKNVSPKIYPLNTHFLKNILYKLYFSKIYFTKIYPVKIQQIPNNFWLKTTHKNRKILSKNCSENIHTSMITIFSIILLYLILQSIITVICDPNTDMNNIKTIDYCLPENFLIFSLHNIKYAVTFIDYFCNKQKLCLNLILLKLTNQYVHSLVLYFYFFYVMVRINSKYTHVHSSQLIYG